MSDTIQLGRDPEPDAPMGPRKPPFSPRTRRLLAAVAAVVGAVVVSVALLLGVLKLIDVTGLSPFVEQDKTAAEARAECRDTHDLPTETPVGPDLPDTVRGCAWPAPATAADGYYEIEVARAADTSGGSRSAVVLTSACEQLRVVTETNALSNWGATTGRVRINPVAIVETGQTVSMANGNPVYVPPALISNIDLTARTLVLVRGDNEDLFNVSCVAPTA